MRGIENDRAHESRTGLGSRSARAAIVLAGMVLFVCGFLLVLASMSGTDDASSQVTKAESESAFSSLSSSKYVGMAGLVMSAAGVLLATVGPALSFVSWSKARR